jgi:hypothetical protein
MTITVAQRVIEHRNFPSFSNFKQDSLKLAMENSKMCLSYQ